MKLFLLKLEISSDSGVGPYTEIKMLCNCQVINGQWKTFEGKTLMQRFHTGSADFSITVLSIKVQKRYYHT